MKSKIASNTVIYYTVNHILHMYNLFQKLGKVKLVNFIILLNVSLLISLGAAKRSHPEDNKTVKKLKTSFMEEKDESEGIGLIELTILFSLLLDILFSRSTFSKKVESFDLWFVLT